MRPFAKRVVGKGAVRRARDFGLSLCRFESARLIVDIRNPGKHTKSVSFGGAPGSTIQYRDRHDYVFTMSYPASSATALSSS